MSDSTSSSDATPSAADQNARFVTQQQRYQKLHERKIRVETEKKSIDQQLASLKASAIEQFGSDDVEELKAMLAKTRRENEQKIADYEKHLDSIDAKLGEIDRELSGESG